MIKAKISATQIESAWVRSASPLVVQIKHTDGSCDSYTPTQMMCQLTKPARLKVQQLIEPRS